VEQGHDLACVVPLARCFELGRGTEADGETAADYYELAASYGVAEAARRLAEIYRDGLGDVAPDPEKAAKYAAAGK
jgi:TPR repeat protein